MSDNNGNWSMTRPDWSVSATQSIRNRTKRKRSPFRTGCLTLFLAFIIGAVIYFLLPMRTNILLLGLDAREQEGEVARTDTIVLLSLVPLRPDVGLVSVPRDLWVTLPDGSENRINTPHVFAELETPGSGPQAVINTIDINFGVKMDYWVRIKFDGVREIVDAFGGVEVVLPRPMSGLEAGAQEMNGDEALAFIRDRASSDDFRRMERGQIFLKGLIKRILTPAFWPKLPAAAVVALQQVETDLPVWQWPRVGAAILRAGPDGLETQVIDRELVTPFITSGGAAVLAPNWDLINPLINEVFGIE